MPEEIPEKENIDVDPAQDDAEAEDQSQEEEVKEPEVEPEADDTFDESMIDPEVRDYTPPKKEEEDEFEDLDETESARIEKVVEGKIRREMEVERYFNENPEFKKYRGAVGKYLAHPNYANLPVHNVAAIVASKDMQKIGAAKEREAQKRVAETKNPGTSVRKTEASKTDWRTAPKDEFEAV